eukprot:822698-Pleurochrysis_carterae.AAC.2
MKHACSNKVSWRPPECLMLSSSRRCFINHSECTRCSSFMARTVALSTPSRISCATAKRSRRHSGHSLKAEWSARLIRRNGFG